MYALYVPGSVFYFWLVSSKPLEKSEKTAVTRRSPAPVKSGSVNSPASSAEPERKPVAKKEPTTPSEGEKQSAAKSSATLMPEAVTVKTEPGTKSPSGHGKSPLRVHIKEEKTE